MFPSPIVLGHEIMRAKQRKTLIESRDNMYCVRSRVIDLMKYISYFALSLFVFVYKRCWSLKREYPRNRRNYYPCWNNIIMGTQWDIKENVKEGPGLPCCYNNSKKTVGREGESYENTWASTQLHCVTPTVSTKYVPYA